MDIPTALARELRLPHHEINEDGVVSRHAGYTVTYCTGCGRPILHAWHIYHEPVCRQRGCPGQAPAKSTGAAEDKSSKRPPTPRPGAAEA